MAVPFLAVICKTPVPGRVKTRLTPPCSPEQAAGLAAAAIADTIAAVEEVGGVRPALILEGEPGDWVPAGFTVVPQRGDGLDERLAHGFADLGGPGLIVGMDTPQVTADDLRAGLDALGGHDASIGDALDGGYWCIGLARPVPEAIVGVPMSLETTGALQRARLAELGYAVVDLRPLLDVDTWADAQAVARTAPGSRFAAALARVRPVQGPGEPSSTP